jgi:acyl-CoA thioester hydrolase
VKFLKKFEILWSDIDMNGHMKHVSYSNYATNVRTGYLYSCGITMENFKAWNIGPVILREFIEYIREVGFSDTIEIDLELLGISSDGKKWALQHNIYCKGKISARIQMEGGWLDIKKRSLVKPLVESFLAMNKSKKFKEIKTKRFYLGLKYNN